MPETITEIDMNKIPAEACDFISTGIIQFADEEKKNIEMVLYDGSVVNHWFWGNIAFDLNTIRLAKKRIPILADHETDRRIGYSTSHSIEDKFTLQGRLLENENAKEIQKDVENGFPFEASLRFDPLKTKIEYVKDGESVEVNDKKLKGPGVVMRNTTIMEGSIVTFGALAKTKTITFEQVTNSKETKIMSENKKEMTKDQFAKDYPELYQEVLSEGIKSEIERFDKFAKHFADNPAFLVDQYQKGTSLNDAVLAENKLLKEQANKQPVENKPEKPAENKVDPAEQEFSDEQKKPEEQKDNADETATEKFMDIARKYASDKKVKVSAAISFCSEKYGKEYKAMLDENTQTE